MQCSDVRPLLDLLCDGALEARDSVLVLEHLKSCIECQYEWTDLEQLHCSFQERKDTFQSPVGLIKRISEKLKDEERKQDQRLFGQYIRTLPTLAIAATFALIGLPLLPSIDQINTRPNSKQAASADVLIEDLISEKTLEPITDRNELAKRVGYDLKYVQLPEWQMNKSGMYKSPAAMSIARFDFVRRRQASDQHLSCYQAPEGGIRANAADFENLEGKRVLFGNHGKFQFALWSQDGRDYMFVTPLSKPQLEEIVRGV